MKKTLGKSDSLAEKPKPFIKWAGGKSQLVNQYKPYFPKRFETYFEPFIGGGIILFSLNPNKAIINDINKNLILTYKVVKEKPIELIDTLSKMQAIFNKKDFSQRKDYYYEIREKYNTISGGDIRKAALFIFLNKTCYNGMYRENSKGKFNVPFGRYKNPKIVDKENIIKVSKMLENVEILCGSFEESLSEVKKGDFIYLDPPYHPINQTSNFTSYNEGGFNEDDQKKLRNVFLKLDKTGALVMLSNSYTKFIDRLYKGYRKEIVLANRAINCKASGRGKIKEYLILNY